MFNFFKRNSDNELVVDLEVVSGDISKYCIEEIAIKKAINLYANVVSKCEFQHYDSNGINKVDDLYYALNIKPNVNFNATRFWNKAITKLFEKGEVMIFQGEDKGLYLADSFERKKSLYYPDQFTDIKSRGIDSSRHIPINDVIYLRLNDCYKSVMESHYSKLAKIVDNVVENYNQTNGRKFVFNIPSGFTRKGIGNEEADETEVKNKAQDYVDKIFKNMFKSFNAVVPLQSNEKLEEISKQTGKSIEEVKKSIDMIYESVALGFQIPIDIFFGKTTEKSHALDEWITLGLDNIFEQLNDELNDKIIHKNDYLKGDRIFINKTKIKHRDLLDSASDIDKLMSNGIKLNEVFELFDKPADKKDPLADKRRYTKNYATSDELEKGGD